MLTATPHVAFVTGASSGMGKAAEIVLAAAGFHEMGTGRNTARPTAAAGVTYVDLYGSTKHAVEGYSQSLDHEIRDHGIRVLLVEPGPINTPFGGHSVQADTPMPLYAAGRRNYDELIAKNLSSGDDPAVVAKVIVAAATDRNPKLRRTAGSTAARISAVHRVAPARSFDRVIRKFNRMPS